MTGRLVRAKRHRENEEPREVKKEVTPSTPREKLFLPVMPIAVVAYVHADHWPD